MYSERINNKRVKPLPSKLFLVRVPIIATYSDAEIDVLGLPVDTNTFGGYNPKTYTNFTTCMLPLDRLVDIYMQNYPIYVIKKEDSVEIYNMLEEYLTGESEPDRVSRNLEPIIEERLADIEKFASEMFGYNKGAIARDMYRRDLELNNQRGMSLSTSGNISIDKAAQILNNNKDALALARLADAARDSANNDNTFGLKTRKASQQSSIIDSNIQQIDSMIYTPNQHINANITNTNISYVHNSLPDFDLDAIERVPTVNGYRKLK